MPKKSEKIAKATTPSNATGPGNQTAKPPEPVQPSPPQKPLYDPDWIRKHNETVARYGANAAVGMGSGGSGVPSFESLKKLPPKALIGIGAGVVIVIVLAVWHFFL
jgi:hypothetical protein